MRAPIRTGFFIETRPLVSQLAEMTRTLKLSLFANVVLLSAVALLLLRSQTPESARPATAEPVATYQPAVPEEPSASSGMGTFSWRQIESSDYRTYLANLRAVGCPDQTVADIIKADVHSLYSHKRSELGISETADSGPWSALEERRVVVALLGRNSSQQNDRPNDVGTALLPLALRKVDPGLLQLDPGQQAALAELREQFVQDIGGTNQDASDPTYGVRWQRAQPENDRLLRGMIGVNAFMRYQNEAQ